MSVKINIIGAGLAGCEAAYQIAKNKIEVNLYEMKPIKFSPAHSNPNLAEIVCSNSFKSNLKTNAAGLLKEELRMLDSLLIKIADKNKVEAGQALAVDREKFAKQVTDEIENNEYIKVIKKEVISCYDDKVMESYKNNKDKYEVFEELIKEGITLIATGPLTSDSLSIGIKKLTNNKNLYFYDAQAPLVAVDSINFDIAFYANRFDEDKKKSETEEQFKERIANLTKEEKEAYINLPMNEDEYKRFVEELVNAEKVVLKDFEKKDIFEACMPVEVMAARGEQTLRYGPLRGAGLNDPRTGRWPYAAVQLRADNKEKTLYNMVGFQTNLKFGEQKRVFSMIPGLENAEFMKYGVMHRNTFINSTKLLDATNCLKKDQNIYFAGQITGVEGYVESIASGMVSALNIVNKVHNREKLIFPKITMIGALMDYISTENDKFQPMNSNFGIIADLDIKIKNKQERYEKIANRSIEYFRNELEEKLN